MKKFTQQFLRDNKGVTAIEYGLIAGLIVLVIAGSVSSLGSHTRTPSTARAGRLTWSGNAWNIGGIAASGSNVNRPGKPVKDQ